MAAQRLLDHLVGRLALLDRALAKSAHQRLVKIHRGLGRPHTPSITFAAASNDPLEPAAGSREIAAIALDQRGNVWAVAADGEVARFDGQHWTTTTELPTHRIHALAVSGDAVWLGTATGALRFDRR